jgi:hypothetical protein
MGVNIMPFSHFVAQITDEGGPDPYHELRRLVERSQTPQKHIAWFKSILGANDFERAGNSICIVFRKTEDRDPIEAVVARIQELHGSGHPDEDDISFYAGWKNLTNWWPLGGLRKGMPALDIALTTFGSIDDIPGCGWESGLSARPVFGGTAVVSGWKFPDGFNTLGWVQKLAAQTK